MIIIVKSVTGQITYALRVSEIIPVSELKKTLEKLTGVKADNLNLYKKQNQLEDGHTTFDYGVRNKDVLQLVVRNKMDSVEMAPCSSTSSKLNIPGDKWKEFTIPAVSKYFQIGDYVDVRDASHGGWYAARIVDIYSKGVVLDEASCSKKTENEEEIKAACQTDNISISKYQSKDNPLCLQSEQAFSNEETKLTSDEEEAGGGIDIHEIKEISSSSNEATTSINQGKPKEEELRASDDIFYKIVIDDEGNEQFTEVSLHDIRPAARNRIKLSDLKKDDLVLVNYNIDQPKKIGNWYDFCVTEVKVKKGGAKLSGTLLLGKEKVPLPSTKIWYLKEIFQIEEPYLLKNRSITDEKIMKMPIHRKSQYITHCTFCSDNRKKKCKECGCCVCGGKKHPEKQILCDECDKAYHLTCVDPPMDQVPDFDWYCPECKTDENETVKDGENLEDSKKKSKMPSSHTERKCDCDSGEVCRECTLVPSNHYGPIPGVEVGQIWYDTVEVSEAGIHRPRLANIDGDENDGAYSLMLNLFSNGDLDYGDEFWYTESGGQDQKLTRMNKALALNCAAELNEKGAEAKNWKEGKPVRVVRNFRLLASKYAPGDGNRYDGIYKVVKYFPEEGKSGFIIWWFLLRRDDSAPAPWTLEEKKRIEAPESCEVKDPEEKTQNVIELKKQKCSTTGSSEKKKQEVKEIFQIEEPYLLKNRSITDEKIMKMPIHRKSQYITHCTFCSDNRKKKCKECGCCVCGEKKHPEKQILCDECDKAYHLFCVDPPMDQVPDFDWYCPECKTDENETVKDGENLEDSKKKSKMPSSHTERKCDCDSGEVCRECTLVPSNHYGPIPGVEVGQIWYDTVEVSEAGIHRPRLANIDGDENDGAYSLMLNLFSNGDLDYGDEFWYTESGGQDQKLTRMNKALALNCAAELNEKGAEAKNWKEGKPVRVVRNFRLLASKYAPGDGNRYDGIYKVVKYFPEEGKSGFIIWWFLLRRDDSAPAPWTLEGKKRIEAPESCEVKDLEEKTQKVIESKKQKCSTTGSSEKKKQEVEPHFLSSDELELMAKDNLNKERWEECCQTLQEGKEKFLSVVQKAFQCVICVDLVRNPVTTPCQHNICNTCLKRDMLTCPCCQASLGADFVADVNNYLTELLGKMFTA